MSQHQTVTGFGRFYFVVGSQVAALRRNGVLVQRLDVFQQILFHALVIEFGLTGLQTRPCDRRLRLAVVEDRNAERNAHILVQLVIQLIVKRVVRSRNIPGTDRCAGRQARQSVSGSDLLAQLGRLHVQTAVFDLRHHLQRPPVHLVQRRHFGQHVLAAQVGKLHVERFVQSQFKQLFQRQNILIQRCLADRQLVFVAAVLRLHLGIIARSDRAGLQQRLRTLQLRGGRLDGLSADLHVFIGVQDVQIGLRHGDLNVVPSHIDLELPAFVDHLLLPQRIGQLAPVVDGDAGLQRIISGIGSVSFPSVFSLF